MARFHEAFIFLAEGADPAQRGAREGALARTEFIPVPDTDTAAATAAELAASGLDLIELHGLGPSAAAKVVKATDGQVPVGVVGVEDGHTLRNRAVIFESAGADPLRDRYVLEHGGGRMTIVAVPDRALAPEVAQALAGEGVEHIAMCGGMGVVPTAAVVAAVGVRVRVVAIQFGFESLPSVAAYRARFEQALGV